jgi:hypothetical protein
MTTNVGNGSNPLARELDEFINVYMRQHTIWFTAAHQEPYQIDEQLRNTLLSLGTYILGGTSSMQSARDLADALLFRDPYLVKHYRNVWGSAPNPRGTREPLYFVIDVEPEFLPLEEQTELFAQRIKKLGRFQFLLRPALSEGHIGSVVLPLTIRHEDIDPYTGEYQFPEQALLTRVRQALAAKSGTPVKKLLQEQENRLLPVPHHPSSTPAPNGSGRQRKSDFQTAQQPQQGGETRHRKPTTPEEGRGRQRKSDVQTSKPPAEPRQPKVMPPPTRRRSPITEDEG